jgi:hypothetical protein
MQTFTISINNNSALKTLRDLEKKEFISIVENDDTDSPALPGKRQSLSQFKKWIAAAEQAPAVSLEDAKSLWSGKRKQLQKNIL